MVPPARHGPQRGACHLWILGQGTTPSRAPLGLLPGPRDYLGATVRGHSQPGPQGEPEAPREEMHRCVFLSVEVQQPVSQTTYEFDAMSKTMEVMTDDPSSREMEHWLNTLQTSLNKVERSIMRYEDLIEDCQMQEEEVRLEEEISWEQEEEEVTDAEMVDEEEHSDPEPSGCHGEADTEGPPPLVSTEDAVSPKEDSLLM